MTDKNSPGLSGDLIYSDATGVIIEMGSEHQVFIPYAAIIRIEKRSAAG